jgi:hypothetical protein
MGMKILPLRMHWDVGEAYSVLAFIDALRGQIIAQYGDEIAQMLREANTRSDEQQLELPFTDLPPF